MKRKIKRGLGITVIVLVGIICYAFFYANLDCWTIRRDLHLGLSPCLVAGPAAEPQITRVAVAALSEAKRQELFGRYTWQKISTPNWYEATPEYGGIPWYEDLSESTEFEPVLRRAVPSGGRGKFCARVETPSWKYQLVSDGNILWIVRDDHFDAARRW